MPACLPIAEAVPVFREALDSFVAVHGPKHLVVAKCLNRLFGSVILTPSGAAEYPALLQRRYEIYREQLAGKDDLSVGVAQREWAQALDWTGRWAEAESVFRETIAYLQRVLGPEHREVAWAIQHYAYALCDHGRFAEAESLARQGLAIWARVEPAITWPLEFMQRTYARALGGLGRREEAECLLFETVALLEPSAAKCSQPGFLWGTYLNLAEPYEAWGRPADAEAWRVAAVHAQALYANR